MKKVLGFVLGLMMAMGTAGLYAAGSFEGEVDYNLNAKGHTGAIQYFMADQNVRINTNNGGHEGAAIMDLQARQMTILMVPQKMYMTSQIPASTGSTASEGTFTDTGNSEVILGKTCEEWVYTSKKGSSTIWGATGMGFFGGLSGRPNDANSVWAAAVQKKGLFPLKIVSKDASGNVVMTMEATKIAPGALDASLFQVPAGFNKMDMANLGNLGAMMGQHPPQ